MYWGSGTAVGKIISRPGGGGGGGGYFHMYAYLVCAANETPIFSHEFPFRSISFSQITNKSVPEHSGRSVASRFHAQNGSSRSGAPCFQTQNGSSSFRSPTFSRARPEARSGALANCSLCRGTYLPEFGVSTPHPPPPPARICSFKLKYLRANTAQSR